VLPGAYPGPPAGFEAGADDSPPEASAPVFDEATEAAGCDAEAGDPTADGDEAAALTPGGSVKPELPPACAEAGIPAGVLPADGANPLGVAPDVFGEGIENDGADERFAMPFAADSAADADVPEPPKG